MTPTGSSERSPGTAKPMSRRCDPSSCVAGASADAVADGLDGAVVGTALRDDVAFLVVRVRCDVYDAQVVRLGDVVRAVVSGEVDLLTEPDLIGMVTAAMADHPPDRPAR